MVNLTKSVSKFRTKSFMRMALKLLVVRSSTNIKLDIKNSILQTHQLILATAIYMITILHCRQCQQS